MEYPNAATWLPTTIPELSTVHDERSSSMADEWKEQVASMQGGGLDFVDIQGEHAPLPYNKRPPPATRSLPAPWLFLLNPLPVSQFQMPHPRQLQTPRLYTFTCRKPTPTHSSTPILLMALVNGNHPHNNFRSPAIPP